jgi:hypothetical protein
MAKIFQISPSDEDAPRLLSFLTISSISMSDNIFDKLLIRPDDPPKAQYYHCIQRETKDYICKLVTGTHRIIPVYPDLPSQMHLQVLEGTLGAPVTVYK